MKSVLILSLAAVAFGDLRMASQPKGAYKNLDRASEAFVKEYGLYMEPSDFNYAGLKAQRRDAYDNFLRSNIDNEQDKRNFNTEPGKDHLPFRSFETAANTQSATVQAKITADTPAGQAITATPGQPYSVPLRWNNPHAAELEINIWIMPNAAIPQPVVVPVMKPTCSGEGYQNQVFQFTIPTDYNQLSLKVPGFKGCNQVNDCVLQVYAHSVESRQYAIGTPLIVNAQMATGQATNQIQAAQPDPGLQLQPLRDVCLARNSPDADIKNAVPRQARLISDVFNHAYQNSDYSPYSGQQPEAISRNLQASVILKMVTGNRGELGKALLAKENPAAAKLQKALEQKAKNVVAKLEGITNKIIAAIQNDAGVKNTDTTQGAQKTALCFRCEEVGSTLAQRLTTNTYVPSFQIPAASMAKAQALVPAQYSALVQTDANGVGTLRIYTTALDIMNAEFVKAAAVGLDYLPPKVKASWTTAADATEFIKKDANGKKDNGQYAAAQANVKSLGTPVTAALLTKNLQVGPKALAAPDESMVAAVEMVEPVYPDTGAEDPEWGRDMDSYEADSNCDNDLTYKRGQMCNIPMNLFVMGADGNLQVSPEFGDISLNGASTATVSFVGVLAALVLALFL